MFQNEWFKVKLRVADLQEYGWIDKKLAKTLFDVMSQSAFAEADEETQQNLFQILKALYKILDKTHFANKTEAVAEISVAVSAIRSLAESHEVEAKVETVVTESPQQVLDRLRQSQENLLRLGFLESYPQINQKVTELLSELQLQMPSAEDQFWSQLKQFLNIIFNKANFEEGNIAVIMFEVIDLLEKVLPSEKKLETRYQQLRRFVDKHLPDRDDRKEGFVSVFKDMGWLTHWEVAKLLKLEEIVAAFEADNAAIESVYTDALPISQAEIDEQLADRRYTLAVKYFDAIQELASPSR